MRNSSKFQIVGGSDNFKNQFGFWIAGGGDSGDGKFAQPRFNYDYSVAAERIFTVSGEPKREGAKIIL